MTWPMHDAGPTTPDPGGDDPQGVPPRRDEPRRNRRWPDPPWNEPPRPEEPEGAEADRTMQLSPGPGLGRGRHSVPAPLPPMEGPMLGGGPTPAETTLPLALSWPAPPARGPRPPRITPPGPPRSEEHTSELQSLRHLVCRLLLEKK